MAEKDPDNLGKPDPGPVDEKETAKPMNPRSKVPTFPGFGTP